MASTLQGPCPALAAHPECPLCDQADLPNLLNKSEHSPCTQSDPAFAPQTKEIHTFWSSGIRLNAPARLVGLTVDQLNLVKLAHAVKQPVLLIHDRDDTEIPASDSRELDKAFPSSRLIETQGDGHSRILKDGRVIGEILEFLNPLAEVKKAS